MRKFNIMPSGLIQGGKFQYSYDPNYGFLSYQITIDVKKWPFKKTIDLDGQQKIEPAKLESEQYRHVGAKIEFANLAGTITKVEGNIATARVKTTDIEAAGSALFDLSGKYAELNYLDAVGKVKVPVIGKIDFHLTVKLLATAGMLAKKDLNWPVEEGKDGEVQPKKP